MATESLKVDRLAVDSDTLSVPVDSADPDAQSVRVDQ